ncbi:DUF2484 family protein [Roseobacter sinensis]|uniref:DUF2484 family protein n=1 Tax=Roseobacter sinensis TaxID=2931391 RepID=A0ABT3BLA0_9RHOB|nr:DUF2484 family protein [Roseobacter sp. WL0113]MCV3273899.1 DUF2484 family protein [Roseobacter sp. WL0113]
MMLLWACIAWVFASAVVAMLPMRHQYVPGVALLIAAPVLIFWVGTSFSWWAAALALFAFVSMYRNPLRYLAARARGQRPEIPK